MASFWHKCRICGRLIKDSKLAEHLRDKHPGAPYPVEKE